MHGTSSPWMSPPPAAIARFVNTIQHWCPPAAPFQLLPIDDPPQQTPGRRRQHPHSAALHEPQPSPASMLAPMPPAPFHRQPQRPQQAHPCPRHALETFTPNRLGIPHPSTVPAVRRTTPWQVPPRHCIHQHPSSTIQPSSCTSAPRPPIHIPSAFQPSETPLWPQLPLPTRVGWEPKNGGGGRGWSGLPPPPTHF